VLAPNQLTVKISMGEVMNSQRKRIGRLVTATLALAFCTSLLGQGPADVTVASRDTSTGTSTSAAPETTASEAAAVPEAPAKATAALPEAPSAAYQYSPYATGGTSGGWRLGISFYGFFPGVHGTVGVLGHNASIHSSFSDVFHVLKGNIPIAVEADKGRFVAPIDFFWIKLGIDNQIPENDLGQTSINTHMTQSILTPKVGYRLVDGDKMKLDALAGIRYWYASIDNTLEPSGDSNSRSTNWIDGIGGARFIFPFGEKAAMTLSGDAGAGESNLDYQAVGLLNFNLTPKFGLGVGWRYLYDNYRPTTNELVYNPTMTGPIAGLTFNTGGKPPVPPTMSCSASPSAVFPGDPVTVTATPEGLNPKWNTVYSWNGEGAAGNGATATVNTSTLAPGSYTVQGGLKEGKPGKEGEKPWQTAGCSASYTVKAFEPPTLSCSANPSDLKPGDSTTISAQGVSPQNRPLTYSYQASGGTISGSDATATYSSAGASSGPVQITCSVSDDKGHTATAATSVNIAAPPPPPPPPPPPSLLLHSVFFPTALPNVKRPDKGLATSQEQILTSLASEFKNYLQVKPDARLTLTGHADPRGGNEYNKALSERRVGTVKNFLVNQGVPESSIDTVAMGDTNPLTKDQVKGLVQSNPDLTDDERAKILRNITQIYLAQNRRVDVTLANTGQQSVQLYPFNAHDAGTLLNEKAQAHAKKQPKQ
jgi:outer membrane protein OmpA-like peptidoglycan-associated protein